MGKKSWNALYDKAWKLHSERIRREAGGICYTCGEFHPWKETHAGHFQHGKYMSFEAHNIQCQCCRCNTFQDGALDKFERHLIEDIGKKATFALMDLKRNRVGTNFQYTEEFLKHVIEREKEFLEVLDEEGK